MIYLLTAIGLLTGGRWNNYTEFCEASVGFGFMVVNLHNLRSGSRVLASVNLCSLEFLTSNKFCTTCKNLLLIITNVDRVIRHIILSISSFWNTRNTSVTKVETCPLDTGHSTPQSREYNCIIPLVRYTSMTPCRLACASVLAELSAIILEYSWKYLENTSSNFSLGTCTNYIALGAVLRTPTLSKMLMFYRIKLDVNQESIRLVPITNLMHNSFIL